MLPPPANRLSTIATPSRLGLPVEPHEVRVGTTTMKRANFGVSAYEWKSNCPSTATLT